MTLFQKKIQMGHLYLRLWPKEKSLAAMFPENRIIAAVEFGMKWLPALAVMSLVLQFHFGQPNLWPVVISSLLFMVSLPLQGYYWLGRRVDTQLPPSLSRWYFDINQKMNCAPSVNRPSYFDLATTLRQAFEKLDRVFLFQ
jgi:uncharacterized membrane protein YfbV (UPF0208 family)